MTICWTVRSVPERAEMLAATMRVVPDALVVVDYEHRGVTWSSVVALEQALEVGADWIGILDDDFHYCPRFVAQLEVLCQVTAQGALVLYSQARPVGKVIEEYEDFQLRRRRAGQLTVAPVMRRRPACLLLKALRSKVKAGDRRAFDGVGARVLYEADIPSAVVWPNPVDHRGRVSALGNAWTVAGRPRVSAWSCAT